MGKCKAGYALSEDGTIPQRCNVDWGDDFYPTSCKECPNYNSEYELRGQAINDNNTYSVSTENISCAKSDIERVTVSGGVIMPPPKPKSILWIGNEHYRTSLPADQHFNWFQKLMWKLFFGVKVEDYSEE